MTKEDKDASYMPRQINLSGNYVNFSMPENFSKDFPAEDLVEQLDLNDSETFKNNDSETFKNNDSETFKNNDSVELMRRWWDFKNNSFMAKNVGSMMMSININKSLDPSKDISNPIEFIQILLLDMAKRDNEENKGKPEESKVHYPEDLQSFVERIYSKQRWLSSGSGTYDESIKVFHFWIPISNQNYLSVEFSFAPNNNISMRPFIDEYCRGMMRKIMGSFDVIYSQESVIKPKIEKNSNLKLEDLIKKLE